MRQILEGRRLFQCGHRKVQHLLEGGAYLKTGAYYKKCGMSLANFEILLSRKFEN